MSADSFLWSNRIFWMHIWMREICECGPLLWGLIPVFVCREPFPSFPHPFHLRELTPQRATTWGYRAEATPSRYTSLPGYPTPTLAVPLLTLTHCQLHVGYTTLYLANVLFSFFKFNKKKCNHQADCPFSLTPYVRFDDLQTLENSGHSWHWMSLLRPCLIKQHSNSNTPYPPTPPPHS